MERKYKMTVSPLALQKTIHPIRRQVNLLLQRDDSRLHQVQPPACVFLCVCLWASERGRVCVCVCARVYLCVVCHVRMHVHMLMCVCVYHVSIITYHLSRVSYVSCIMCIMCIICQHIWNMERKQIQNQNIVENVFSIGVTLIKFTWKSLFNREAWQKSWLKHTSSGANSKLCTDCHGARKNRW